MLKVKRAALLLLVAVAAPLLLCGCLQFNMHLTINRNRSADLEITLAAPRAILAMDPDLEKEFFVEKKEDLAAQGFDIIEPTDEKVAGFKAAKRLRSVTELADLGLAGDMGLQDQEIFIEEKSALTTTYHLDAQIDLKDLMGEQGNLVALLSPDLRFILTLPVKPLAHNADEVTEDGRTLVWELSPLQSNHLQLTARAPNLSAVILGVVAAVALIAAVILAVVYRPKLKKSRPTTGKGKNKKKPV
ncbi:MAG: DUF3153 domain-containing protein [Firmicutes bacterium]|nr:DUF3153 domain-containing protein [Bacillota bacterium]